MCGNVAIMHWSIDNVCYGYSCVNVLAIML